MSRKLAIALLMTLSTVCFAHTKDVEPNIERAEQMTQEGHRDRGIAWLDYLIHSKKVPDVDKIHYMVKKLSLISVYLDEESINNLIKEIDDLTKANYLCYLELKYSYEMDYLSPKN
jgi:uncharacterized protein YlbG (UPF0298 family)